MYVSNIISRGCLLDMFLRGSHLHHWRRQYWLKMFDSFAGTIGLVVVALMEMIAVIYIYGHKKFTQDIFDMTGIRPGPYWQITWRFLAPGIMVVILLSAIIDMILKTPKYQAWIAEKVIHIDRSVFRIG